MRRTFSSTLMAGIRSGAAEASQVPVLTVVPKDSDQKVKLSVSLIFWLGNGSVIPWRLFRDDTEIAASSVKDDTASDTWDGQKKVFTVVDHPETDQPVNYKLETDIHTGGNRDFLERGTTLYAELIPDAGHDVFAPPVVTATKNADGDYVITHSTIEGAEGYEYRMIAGDTVGDWSEPTFPVTEEDLAANTEHYFMVRAYKTVECDKKVIGYPGFAKVITDVAAPTVSISRSGVNLTVRWSSPGATKYRYKETDDS